MRRNFLLGFMAIAMTLATAGCAGSHDVERANQSATRYWTEKAAPGKTIEVQVLATTKVENGKYRVRAMVDGQQRVGHFSPETGTFDEGYRLHRKPKADKND